MHEPIDDVVVAGRRRGRRLVELRRLEERDRADGRVVGGPRRGEAGAGDGHDRERPRARRSRADISWNETGEEAVRRFKKGDELETVILSVDPERERISLGIKQLEDDPFSNFVAVNDKGAIVKGIVKEVDAKGAIVTLADDIEATLKASEISRDRVEDARNVLKEGEEIEAKIISVDRKSRVISLSIKSKDDAEEREAIQSLKNAPEAAADTTMAALLREAMAKQN